MPPQVWKPYTVKTKAAWGDAWTARPDLIVQELSLGTGLQIDTASVVWRHGTMMQPDDAVFSAIAALPIVGQYIRIEATAPVIDWVGYLVSEQGTRWAKDGGVISGGDQAFRAVGMEWFLDRVQISSSVHFDTNKIDRPVGFNTGLGEKKDTKYSERGNMDTRANADGARVFAADKSNRAVWTGNRMVEYLLEYFSPESDLGVAAPLPFVGSLGTALDWFDGMIRLENRTTRAVLNDIINPRRGLVWWLEYDSVGDQMDVIVSSTVPVAFAIPGGGTLPAAATLRDWDFDDDPEVVRASVGEDTARNYDQVRVRGARRTATMTVSTADSTLEEGWHSGEESAYNQALSETNKDAADRFRKQDRFKNVYQTFRIPAAWDGKSGDGGGVTTKIESSPLMAQGSTSIISTEAFVGPGLRMLRQLPIHQSWDYTDATAPVAREPITLDPDFMQPYCVVEQDTKWVPMHHAARSIDEDTSASKRLKTSYNMVMMNGVPGFRLIASKGLPHALAENHFDPATDAPSNTKPEVDFDDMRATVAVEWDSYCEGWHPDATPTAAPLQELVIYVGNRLRLDYLAQGTIFDLTDAGVPKTVTTGGPIRDDRAVCRKLASLAYQWYQTPRRTLVIEYSTLSLPAGGLAIGDLIEDIGSVATLLTINATVTQISYHLEAGTSRISAGYAELDLAGVF